MTKPTTANGTEKTADTASQETTQSLLDLGAALTKSSRGAIYCLAIIGQIEGHSEAPNSAKTTKYEHILPLLTRLEQAEEVDGVLFLLNTVGGDVEARLAIAELMAGCASPRRPWCWGAATPSASPWQWREGGASPCPPPP